MIKRAYQLVALLALLHLVALGGVGGYLFATGKVDRAQIEQIAAVLRGGQPQIAEAAPTTQPSSTQPSAVETAPEPSPPDELHEQMLRLKADRREAELAQRLGTVAAAQIEVTRQREALKREAEELQKQLDARRDQEASTGFKKDLELLANLKPKDAAYYLLQKPTEEAARMLLMMETRKAKKIIESAKSPDQRKTVSEILEVMRGMTPADGTVVGELTEDMRP